MFSTSPLCKSLIPLIRKNVTIRNIAMIHAVAWERSAVDGGLEMCSGRLDVFLTGYVTQCEL